MRFIMIQWLRETTERLSGAMRRDRVARGLVGLGALLLASGVAHAGVWLIDGASSLAGPVSWRKPIVFGLSSGITTLSVAWLAAHLAPSTWRARWAGVYAATMALEILLIDMQRWRGVGSHFNVATPLDGLIFSLMGVLICVSVTAVGALGWRFSRSASVAEDLRAAGGAGVALLLLGSAIGGWMAAHGSTIGATGGGLWKLPHGLALHAIQTLPALAWWLQRRGVGVGGRRRLILIAAAGHAALVAIGLALAAGWGA
jgi:hypothetical protein